MSRSKPETRLILQWDIKRKRVQLSAAGVVGVIGVCVALVTGIVALARML